MVNVILIFIYLLSFYVYQFYLQEYYECTIYYFVRNFAKGFYHFYFRKFDDLTRKYFEACKFGLTSKDFHLLSLFVHLLLMYLFMKIIT